MSISDILFPPHCVSCQKSTINQSNFYLYLCPDCLKKIDLIKNNFCYGCHKPSLLGETCQKCKKRGGDLNAHHIIPFYKNYKKDFSIKEGITFCLKCHKLFHRTYGIIDFNKENIKEFIL